VEVLTIIGILIVLLVGWMIWSKLTWKTIMVSSDIRSEEALRDKYKRFKSENIRCQLKKEMQTPIVTGVSPVISNHVDPNSHGSVLKLMVHRRDIYKVNQLKS
jgi:beta-lactamase regulating signal transducer with metallopeptidase domain